MDVQKVLQNLTSFCHTSIKSCVVLGDIDKYTFLIAECVQLDGSAIVTVVTHSSMCEEVTTVIPYSADQKFSYAATVMKKRDGFVMLYSIDGVVTAITFNSVRMEFIKHHFNHEVNYRGLIIRELCPCNRQVFNNYVIVQYSDGVSEYISMIDCTFPNIDIVRTLLKDDFRITLHGIAVLCMYECYSVGVNSLVFICTNHIDNIYAMLVKIGPKEGCCTLSWCGGITIADVSIDGLKLDMKCAPIDEKMASIQINSLDVDVILCTYGNRIGIITKPNPHHILSYTTRYGRREVINAISK